MINFHWTLMSEKCGPHYAKTIAEILEIHCGVLKCLDIKIILWAVKRKFLWVSDLTETLWWTLQIHDDLEKEPEYSGSGFGPDDEDSTSTTHNRKNNKHGNKHSHILYAEKKSWRK